MPLDVAVEKWNNRLSLTAAIDADALLDADQKAAMKELVTVVYKQLTEGKDGE